ncbi:MAG: hypothetical protein CEO19_190 [Parcubacteria group bacterium Gr01-1014_73]|nr:MAG: hypothetical protein CEO19_190 [Parcubacteria group bacterium Gr01-1014_73]
MEIASKIIWWAVELDPKDIGLTLLVGGLLIALYLTIAWRRHA